MKRLLAICLLIIPLLAFGQQDKQHVTYITIDTLGKRSYDLVQNWLFHLGDSAGAAAPAYDDSKWQVLRRPNLYINPDIYDDNKPPTAADTFTSIGWFRLHFVTDSSITGIPLALGITHFGASEIYLDGKKITSYGKIDGPKNSVYYDPQQQGFAFVINNAGEHVLAIRYANYDASHDDNVYKRGFSGFTMLIATATNMLGFDRHKALVETFIYIFLFGLFLALAMLHLFLYLYYRAEHSNLFFSIFAFSLAFIFLVWFVNVVSHSPKTELNDVYVVLLLVTTACFSFSGLTNELFSNSKLRFKLITASCIVSAIVFVFYPFVGYMMFIFIGTVITLEAIILTIGAINKKVRGARIIGFGILFFAFFILSMVGLMLHGHDISDGTPQGQFLLLIMASAILSVPISMSVYLAWNFSSINKNLKNQLQQVELLSEKTLQQELEKQRLLENRQEELEKEVAIRTEEISGQKEKIEKQHDELKKEKSKSDELLLNILPAEIAEELKETGTSEAKFFDHVSVLFTDFVDFTKAGETMGAQALVNELHTCFKAFDEICAKYDIEKIKTIGDAYLAVCGLPAADTQHAAHVAMAALDIKDFIANRKQDLGDKAFDIRIGIHSGSVVAGIVGVKKFAYDIWGDTVNTAARMEQHGERGKINISDATYELIKDRFECTYRGKITAKNKGEMDMYFIEKSLA